MPFDINKANVIHENKYDYSLVEYKNIDTKVNIICSVHGIFTQTPYHHINRKQGCGKCKGVKISETKRFDVSEFIIKANHIHKNKYDYSYVEYINSHTHIKIICPIHGLFSQKPNNHLYSKNGCPSCGYNKSKTSDEWLFSLGVALEYHEKHIKVGGVSYKVDAYVPENNTVYEYFGNFWHGNPEYYNPDEINPKNKIKFGILYKNTINRIENIKNGGYNLIFKWGK